MRGQLVEEAPVALGAILAIEEFTKVNLHGLATRRSPRRDGIANFLWHVLDLQRH